MRHFHWMRKVLSTDGLRINLSFWRIRPEPDLPGSKRGLVLWLLKAIDSHHDLSDRKVARNL
jgi:hypothetical protein